MDGALSRAATMRRIVMLFLGIAMIVSTVFASSVRRPAALRLVENHAVSAAAPQVPQTP
jgi:hypothetical protein